MQTKVSSVFSVLAVPVLGIGVLLIGLWHTGPTDDVSRKSDTASQVYLIEPDARLDKSLTVYLRQQARNVAQCRERLHAAEGASGHIPQAEARWHREGLSRAVDGYNLIARECTPAVFRRTGMPSSLTF